MQMVLKRFLRLMVVYTKSRQQHAMAHVVKQLISFMLMNYAKSMKMLGLLQDQLLGQDQTLKPLRRLMLEMRFRWYSMKCVSELWIIHQASLHGMNTLHRSLVRLMIEARGLKPILHSDTYSTKLRRVPDPTAVDARPPRARNRNVKVIRPE